MAHNSCYPRTLPTSLNDVVLDATLRQYHTTADKIDELFVVLSNLHKGCKTPQAIRLQSFLVNRVNRLLQECQGWKELVLIYQESPDEKFRHGIVYLQPDI